MIEDAEMRDLFRIESHEHIQLIEAGLLKIEKDPGDRALLDELFREAHSLKGASRMLELSGIEAIFHRFEDVLGKASKGGMALAPETIDGMHRSLDAVRKLVDEAVSGVAANVVVSEVLAGMQSALVPWQSDSSQAGECASAISPQSPAIELEAIAHVSPFTTGSSVLPGLPETTPSHESISGGEDTAQSVAPVAKPEHFVIETIRVETRKLDTLMTHAGELTVAKIRIARRHVDIEECQEKWEQIANGLRSLSSRVAHLMPWVEQLNGMFDSLNVAAYEDSARLEFVSGELEEGIRSIRLLPFSTIFSLYGAMVRKLARESGKEVELHIEGGDITADKRILEEMKDPLMHTLRNAIDHGIESPDERVAKGKPRCGNILLHAFQLASTVVIEIKDDGRGLVHELIKRSARKSRLWRQEELDAMSLEQLHNLIFTPGFSTSSFVSDVSGRGVGMDVVRANAEKLKGTVAITTEPGASCTVSIRLPLTLSTTRVLIIVSEGNKYAVPVEFVQKSYPLNKKDLFTIEGHMATVFENKAVAVIPLANILEFRRNDFLNKVTDTGMHKHAQPCIILDVASERFGLLVDEILDEQEIVLKVQSNVLQRVSDLSGATILGTGEVCMVLNPPDFISKLKQQSGINIGDEQNQEQTRKQLILLAEDSLTTRAQMKRILESGGYEVVTAVDGLDALNKLPSRQFDAIVSDINMPNLDGLSLTKKVRENKNLSELPIILVTMLTSEEDKRRGLEVGANAYISKAAFDQKLLLDSLRRLV